MREERERDRQTDGTRHKVSQIKERKKERKKY